MQVLLHVAQKLQQIHAAGYAHRDVKPSNVILDSRTKQWVLIDFASAAPIGEEKSLSFSLQFAAPEIAAAIVEKKRTVVVSSAVDVWALGIMAWTLLTGKAPYARGTDIMTKLLGTHTFPWEETLDGETLYKLGILAPSVMSMLHRDPDTRATIDELLDTWSMLFHCTMPETPVKGPASNSTRSTRGHMGTQSTDMQRTDSWPVTIPLNPEGNEMNTYTDYSNTNTFTATGDRTVGNRTREDAFVIIGGCMDMSTIGNQTTEPGVERSLGSHNTHTSLNDGCRSNLPTRANVTGNVNARCAYLQQKHESQIPTHGDYTNDTTPDLYHTCVTQTMEPSDP